MKTIEEHQLFGLLAPVNNSNVDRDSPKEMLKRQRALQKAAKKAATGRNRGPTRWYIGGEPCKSLVETYGLL